MVTSQDRPRQGHRCPNVSLLAVWAARPRRCGTARNTSSNWDGNDYQMLIAGLVAGMQASHPPATVGEWDLHDSALP